MIIDILLIAFIVVSIVDISGIVQSIKRGIWKYLKGNKEYVDFRLKPFDCSYCLTFWFSLLYLIISSSLSLWSVALVLAIAYLTPYIKDLILLTGQTIQRLIDLLFRAVG